MFFEDVAVGQRLPELVKRPGTVTLFRFSAATWNAHRIHYDLPYARSEGYPGVLVHAHLHGAYLAEAALAWTDGVGRLRRFRWENRAVAVAGDVLTCTGRVCGTRLADGAALVELELEERDQSGALCAPAWACVELPRRAAVDEVASSR